MWKKNRLWISVQNFKSTSWKTAELDISNVISHNFSDFSIFQFSIFERFGCSKKCFMVILTSTEIWPKHASHHPNPKFKFWQWLISEGPDTTSPKVWRVPKSIPDTTHAISSALFQLDIATLPGNETGWWVLKTDIWTDLWFYQWTPYTFLQNIR